MPDAEIPLNGGNMEPVVRVGDTVRRATGEWTPAVHDLLRAYEAAGIAETSRPLGIDERGREVLTYLTGSVLTEQPAEIQWDPEIMCEAARLLRRLHEASLPLVDEERHWRVAAHPPLEVICHGDFAPYNLLVTGGGITGVIDVDFAAPGSRLSDLSYLAYRMVPYAEDAMGFDAVRHGEREERLAALIAAYGIPYSSDLVRAKIVPRLIWLADFTDARAAETGRAELHAHAAMYRRDAVQVERIAISSRDVELLERSSTEPDDLDGLAGGRPRRRSM